MVHSEFVAQQQERESKGLKTLLIQTMFASFVLHSGLMSLNWQALWKPQPQLEDEIAIVVTDSEEPQVEQTPLEPEIDIPDLLTSEGGGGGGGGGAPEEAAPVEALSELIEPPQPVAKLEPTPLPLPDPEAIPDPEASPCILRIER